MLWKTAGVFCASTAVSYIFFKHTKPRNDNNKANFSSKLSVLFGTAALAPYQISATCAAHFDMLMEKGEKFVPITFTFNVMRNMHFFIPYYVGTFGAIYSSMLALNDLRENNKWKLSEDIMIFIPCVLSAYYCQNQFTGGDSRGSLNPYFTAPNSLVRQIAHEESTLYDCFHALNISTGENLPEPKSLINWLAQSQGIHRSLNWFLSERSQSWFCKKEELTRESTKFLTKLNKGIISQVGESLGFSSNQGNAEELEAWLDNVGRAVKSSNSTMKQRYNDFLLA
eukprot:gb/GECH01013901.1/.p1 GENE.gb/GECH01013901.1/~~gb/GECH01013901.1/.p1  ORF type:complete len:283 (+),score=50.84 gb/GECH01013901.1/:1-849(+)